MFGKHPNQLIHELDEARKAASFMSGNRRLQDLLCGARSAIIEANEIFTLLPELANKLKRWPTNEEINAARRNNELRSEKAIKAAE